MNAKATAYLLIAAAVLTNVAFTALGSVFNYPDVLDEPAREVLAEFHASQRSIGTWFLVLALSAALFAPIAIGVGRLSPTRNMRIAVRVGIAAAVVQVIGLLRWPVLVPGYAADASSADPAVARAAEDSFRTAHAVLGTAIGETFGYLLTALWTVLVLVAVGRACGGRWFRVLGGAAAVLIAAGVASPLDVPGVDLANFVGYILWSVWLVAFGALILRDQRRSHPAARTPHATRAPLAPAGWETKSSSPAWMTIELPLPSKTPRSPAESVAAAIAFSRP